MNILANILAILAASLFGVVLLFLYALIQEPERNNQVPPVRNPSEPPQ